MREVYYTPEEEQIISTIVPNNTFEELKILLSIDSRNVQRALWDMHSMNKDFVDMWIDTITPENAKYEQAKIQRVALYPNYSSSPTPIRMQCIDVVDWGGETAYKKFIELFPNERVVPINERDVHIIRVGVRSTQNRKNFEVYEPLCGVYIYSGAACPPYCVCSNFGSSNPYIRDYIISEDDYLKLWNNVHMSIKNVNIYYKEDSFYFSSYARIKAVLYIESTKILESLLNDSDSIVRETVVRKLQGERLRTLKTKAKPFIQESKPCCVETSHQSQEQQRLMEQQMQEMLQGSILFFDTETTGTPKNYKAPISDSYNWPRLVQLAWIMADKNGNVLKKKSLIIRPSGFSISEDAAAVHGITTEKAEREGVLLHDVLEEFEMDLSFAGQIVGHNIDFDQHIVGAELYRLGMNSSTLMDKSSTCTMKSSTDFCAIPNPNPYFGGYKWPSLQELYCKLFGHEFSDAHDALADITATKECYFELKRRGIIKE